MKHRRILGIAAACMLGAAAVGVLPATAADATPVCTTVRDYRHAMMPATDSGSLFCHLQRGNFSLAVGYLQAALKHCYGQNIATDSDFGPATEHALKVAQAVEKIATDGVYGPETARHIWFLNEARDGSCTKI
jgi:hypothetical protein